MQCKYFVIILLILQQKKGFVFESETDTEVIVKLVKHIYDGHKDNNISFRECVEMAIQQLVCLKKFDYIMFNKYKK